MSGELAKALVAAQKEMPAIKPNARANYGTYVTLDHMLAKALPVLNKNGVALIQFPCVLDGGLHGLSTILIHESGDTLEYRMPLILPKADPQGLGSALTYARRYAAAAALGISSEEDDDAQAVTQTVQRQAAQPTAATSGGAPSEEATPQPPQPVSDFPIPNTVGPQSSEPEWRWPSGKHKSKTLAETPLEYVLWYRDNGPREDAKEKINAFLGESGVAAVDGDNIPFGEAA